MWIIWNVIVCLALAVGFGMGKLSGPCPPGDNIRGDRHDVSVMDLVDRAEKGECISLELINKEFGGAINHLLLLKGMLLERCGLCSREFDAEDLDRERPSWTKPEKNADCGCR